MRPLFRSTHPVFICHCILILRAKDAMAKPQFRAIAEKFMSKSQIMVLGALVTCLVMTSGCTRLRAHQGYIGDQTLLASVQPGVDNKESVQASLGRPTFVGQFDTNDWYYYARDTRQLAFAQPNATSQFVLKVRFDQAGNVASVSKTGKELISQISPEGDKTPTLGRNKSFFEEIFGNIGSVGAGSGQGSTPNSPN
jgi:outer membrane protein assembly factor BamE (lipoprotein component of BamABCDE complex)